MADAFASAEVYPLAAAQPITSRKTLDELKRMLSDYLSTTETNTTQGLVDYDYYDGKQLRPDEVSALKSRGQPDIIVNRTRVAVNGILGIISRSHTDPKANPVGPSDDETASLATDILRYVTEREKFGKRKKEFFKDYLLGGTTAILVGADQDKNVTLEQIRWEEFFVDPRSRRPDCADARYMGIAKWMYADDVEALFPGKFKAADIEGQGGGAGGMTNQAIQDRPLNQIWFDQRNRRLMTVEVYYRYGGSWTRCVFYYGGILFEADSPYIDTKKRPTNPIKAQSCYVDRENQRYGVVRDMRDLQDEINKRRSKLLHLINSSQIQARDPSAIEVNAEDARLEAARPDGVIPYGWEKVSTTDMSQGQMILLTEAKNEMERFGPNPAVLGRQGADTSGRALLARQQAGLIELAVILDQMDDFETSVYAACWERVKQFWDAPKIIRVTEDTDAPRFLQINEPVMGPVPAIDPATNGPAIDPMTGQPIMMNGVLGYKNAVAELDVDITLDTAPATATIMEEQVKELMALVQSNPAYANQVPFEVFLELMPIPRKRQLIAKIKAYSEAQAQAAAEKEQMATRVALDTAAAEIKLTEAKTGLTDAKTLQAGVASTAKAADTSIDTALALHEITTPDKPVKGAAPPN